MPPPHADHPRARRPPTIGAPLWLLGRCISFVKRHTYCGAPVVFTVQYPKHTEWICRTPALARTLALRNSNAANLLAPATPPRRPRAGAHHSPHDPGPSERRASRPLRAGAGGPDCSSGSTKASGPIGVSGRHTCRLRRPLCPRWRITPKVSSPGGQRFCYHYHQLSLTTTALATRDASAASTQHPGPPPRAPAHMAPSSRWLCLCRRISGGRSVTHVLGMSEPEQRQRTNGGGVAGSRSAARPSPMRLLSRHELSTDGALAVQHGAGSDPRRVAAPPALSLGYTPTGSERRWLLLSRGKPNPTVVVFAVHTRLCRRLLHGEAVHHPDRKSVV